MLFLNSGKRIFFVIIFLISIFVGGVTFFVISEIKKDSQLFFTVQTDPNSNLIHNLKVNKEKYNFISQYNYFQGNYRINIVTNPTRYFPYAIRTTNTKYNLNIHYSSKEISLDISIDPLTISEQSFNNFIEQTLICAGKEQVEKRLEGTDLLSGGEKAIQNHLACFTKLINDKDFVVKQQKNNTRLLLFNSKE